MRSTVKPLTVLVAVLLGGPAPPAGADQPAPEEPRAWGLPGELDREVIEQYLSALDGVRLEGELEVGGVPGDSSLIGVLLARHGTVLRLAAEFDAGGLSTAQRADGPVITRLEIGTASGQLLRLGPLTLAESEPGRGVVWLGPAGELCLGVDLEIGWLFRKNFREELCIESTEMTADGAVEFRSRRRGLLARWVVPELRINREGVVEKRGLPLLRWIGGWRPLDRSAPRIPMPLPLHDWPIHLPDLLDWLPVVEEAKQPGGALTPKSAGGLLPPIAVPAMTLRLDSEMERGEVTIADPAATLRFADHELHLVVHGGFDGRTFRTDAERRSSLEATWTVSGTVEDESLGRLELGGIRIDLDGGLDARLPLEAIERRHAEVEFDVAIGLALAALDVRTEEGLAVALPGGLQGEVRGRGFARLVAGETTPRIGLSPDSTLALRIPGPLVLDRPAPAAGPPPLLRLPTRLHLSAASAGRPLLSFDGRLGSAAATDPAAATPRRNLLAVAGRFEMAARGGDRFGLRAPGGLAADLAAGAGIGLAGEIDAELGFAGLERLAAARLALRLELPEEGGEFRLTTPRGTAVGGRLGRGHLSLDTGPLAPAGGSTLVARAGRIGGELPLALGRGEAPSEISGDALASLEGGFALRLDPARRKAEPRQPLLVGPLRADLRLGLGLEAGLTMRLAEPPVPIVLRSPVRMQLELAGEIGPGGEPQDLGAIEVSIERWSRPADGDR